MSYLQNLYPNMLRIISETLDEAVKIMYESTSKGRKAIRKIGPDDKTGIDWY